MAVARLRGIPPSELMGVGCDWCAYCLDEALLVREAATAKRGIPDPEADAREAEERVRKQMQADGVIP